MEFKTSARVFAVTAGLGFALVGVPVVALADDAVALPEGTTVVTVDMTTETAQPEKNDAVAEEVAAPSVDEYVNKDQAAPDNSKSDAVEQPSDGVTDAIPSTKDGTPDVSDGADKNEEPAGKDDPSVKVSDSEQPSAGTVSDPAFKDGQLSESTDSSVSDANPSSNKTTGWSKDGNSYSDGTGKAYTGWVIDDHAGNGLQRWYVKNGLLFRDGLFESNDAAWGSGWAFARADTGYVVRGKYIDPLTGFVYLADNNGKLLAPGWQVSSDFGDGLQRYYIESGSHACEPGRSDNGWAHYTTKQGYVVRGKHDDAQGHVWLADNDGKLESTKGWLVTTKYDGGGINWQRYYMCSGEFAGSAKSARFYATDEHGVQAFYFGMVSASARACRILCTLTMMAISPNPLGWLPISLARACSVIGSIRVLGSLATDSLLPKRALVGMRGLPTKVMSSEARWMPATVMFILPTTMASSSPETLTAGW